MTRERGWGGVGRGRGNEKECRAHTQPALTHKLVLPSGNTIGVLDRDLMPWELQ